MKHLAFLNSFALSIRTDGTYEPFSAEAWKYVGEMILLGMGMIFCVLGILWGVLALFKVVFVGKEKKPKPVAPRAAAPKAEPARTVVAEESAPISAPTDDAQLIAVLTAAIEAYRSAEGEVGGFRVVSFKRATSGRAWNAKK